MKNHWLDQAVYTVFIVMLDNANNALPCDWNQPLADNMVWDFSDYKGKFAFLGVNVYKGKHKVASNLIYEWRANSAIMVSGGINKIHLKDFHLESNGQQLGRSSSGTCKIT